MRTKNIKKSVFYLGFVLLLLFVDQLTKHLARIHLVKGPVTVIPNVFSFTYLENRGSVWGILQGKTVFLTIVSVILLAVIMWFFCRLPDTRHFLPMRLIMIFITAGAIGNLIDRIVFGFVTDFFYFELINFPIFNVADIYISVSAVFMLILMLFYYKDEDFQWKKSNSK